MKQHPYAWRYLSAAYLLAFLGIAILVQIVRIQTSPEVAGIIDQAKNLVKDYFPPRGEIYDRHGSLLAGNKTVYEIGLDLTTNPDMPTIQLALQMSGLDMDEVNYRISQAAPMPSISSWMISSLLTLLKS